MINYCLLILEIYVYGKLSNTQKSTTKDYSGTVKATSNTFTRIDSKDISVEKITGYVIDSVSLKTAVYTDAYAYTVMKVDDSTVRVIVYGYRSTNDYPSCSILVHYRPMDNWYISVKVHSNIN